MIVGRSVPTATVASSKDSMLTEHELFCQVQILFQAVFDITLDVLLAVLMAKFLDVFHTFMCIEIQNFTSIIIGFI